MLKIYSRSNSGTINLDVTYLLVVKRIASVKFPVMGVVILTESYVNEQERWLIYIFSLRFLLPMAVRSPAASWEDHT